MRVFVWIASMKFPFVVGRKPSWLCNINILFIFMMNYATIETVQTRNCFIIVFIVHYRCCDISLIVQSDVVIVILVIAASIINIININIIIVGVLNSTVSISLCIILQKESLPLQSPPSQYLYNYHYYKRSLQNNVQRRKRYRHLFTY